ncbi:MAG: MTAP family purine nucleoside phosphorylase [Planctomycetota bacterium]
MLGLIAGTSLRKSDIFSSLVERPTDTPHGKVLLFTTPAGAPTPMLFCQRHDRDGQFVPPHNVNYHGNLRALRDAGATRIVAIYSVGGLSLQHGPGTLVIPDDYFHPWSPATYSERGPDCKFIAPQLDAAMREKLIAIAAACPAVTKLVPRGVYVQTPGPRFETRAEVRYLRQLGDIIGMTGANEATLAQELDVPFGMVCMVDNHANGITAAPLSIESFHAAVEANRLTMEALVRDIIAAFATA